MTIIRYYSKDSISEAQRLSVLKQLQAVCPKVVKLQVEKCYHVEITTNEISKDEESILRWLLKHPQDEGKSLKTGSTLPLSLSTDKLLIEIGPRFNFSTAFSTNCVNICQNAGLNQVSRLEASIRYLITFKDQRPHNLENIIEVLGDRMTECSYTSENIPKSSFNENLPKSEKSWYHIPLLEKGRAAIEEVNEKLGLAFSDWDIEYYSNLFGNILKRNPTTVELFDCAQSNSEHSRHWFFRGKMIVDGEEEPLSLIRMIMNTQDNSHPNNTIKFSDNSSAIRGFNHITVAAKSVDKPDEMIQHEANMDLIFTAETHNMPTAVAPFSGATTGTGGRLRDVQGVGRGGIPIAGTAGYSVGCLNIPGYEQPYENSKYDYPSTFAKPLKILIDASDGASDYGNKFGEPVISGFVNSYGITNAQGERDEYVKPIMFSGGLGIMDARMRKKIDPKRGMLLAKIGGPVYRIGVGGGAASSVEVQGSNASELDFNAVQRGDAEMENKLNRVVRACIEMGDRNPILAIHDQGAGGNGNVLKELVEPGFAGAAIFSKEFQLGDPTINALELWGAEYQENNAILCNANDRDLLERICARERCPINFVGVVTGNGKVTLIESEANFKEAVDSKDLSKLGPIPFDLELKHVLGEMPKREYKLERKAVKLLPLKFDRNIDFATALERVFSTVAVGSKRFLTNKVDRCVTGLIAQQQCIGPLHTPLADFGAVIISHFGHEGIATSIGTQPIKGLLDAPSMARMCVAEAISNLAFICITDLADVKCSGNWMWAAKLPGEGAKLVDACKEMCTMMKELRIAVDGGKDSLSMAAKVGAETVVSPSTLVVSAYAPSQDVTLKATPDLKGPNSQIETSLLWVNIEGKFRLGGSTLAQVYSQQGDECPTVLRSDLLAKAFKITQNMLRQKKVLAGHDISDGGLLVCIMEMAMSGLAGVDIDLTEVMENLKDTDIDKSAVNNPELAILFAEECGWILEIQSHSLTIIQDRFAMEGIPTYFLGTTNGLGMNATISIKSNRKTLLSNTVVHFFKQWERTSFELEKLQANVDCVTKEYESLHLRKGPKYYCSVDVMKEIRLRRAMDVVRVALIREEGINSDREMVSSLIKANFEVHDVTMSDLLSGKTHLGNYRGVIFPGGFSYADTLGSAKGWAANIMFSKVLAPQFKAFRDRKNTFSLGICNGCQLMCLLGWVGVVNKDTEYRDDVVNVADVALLHNKSERFECRWVNVHIKETKAIMFRKLKNSSLGCWVAHGEGRFSFRDDKVYEELYDRNCLALEYVDDSDRATEEYPMNPNGSMKGIAGLCSEDGRHLALMPHPERSTAMIQWPYIPPSYRVDASQASPWQLMFIEAYEWCNIVL